MARRAQHRTSGKRTDVIALRSSPRTDWTVSFTQVKENQKGRDFNLSTLGGSAALASAAGAGEGTEATAALAITAANSLIVGLGLEAAGILVIIGRGDYRTWRRWQKEQRDLQ